MIDQLICSIICAKVMITKYERQEPPKVEQRTESKDSIRKDDAKQVKTIFRQSNNRQHRGGDSLVLDTIEQYFGEETPEVLEIVRRESTFNPKAINKSSGACGLFQSLPCKKMNCSLDDVECQVKWGRSYIKSRYGSAENALAFHDRMGWY